MGTYAFQFDKGVADRKLPVGFGITAIPMVLPGYDFSFEGLFVRMRRFRHWLAA
jgi:hypothetical protein